MAGKIKIDEVEVVIDIPCPRSLGVFGGHDLDDDAWRREANSVLEQVKRHVDADGRVTLRVKTITRCEFCGRDPEDNKGTIEPTCCLDATDEWDRTRSTKED